MCTGAEIGLLAASAATTGAGISQKQKAADKASGARASKITAELDRQKILDEESKSKALNTLQQFEGENLAQEEEKNISRNLEQVGRLIEESPRAQSFQASTTPQIIKDTFSRSKGVADEAGSKFAQALAKVAGSGQALQSANLKGRSNQQLIDILGNQKRLSASLLPNEIENALALADSPSGAALTALGQTGLSATLSGAFSPTENPILNESTSSILRRARPTTTRGGLDISKIIKLS